MRTVINSSKNFIIETKRSEEFKSSKRSQLRIRFNLYHIGLILIFVIAFVLRFHHINEQSLGLDELGEATTVNNSFDHFFNTIRGDAAAAPLDYIGVKLFVALLGNSVLTVRLWAFSLGCLSILMIYVVGASMFRSRLSGLVSATMLTFSAFHIYYSQEARFYSLTIFMALASLYLFNQAFIRQTWKSWAAFGIILTFGIYTHYFLVILPVAEGTFLAGYWFWQWFKSGRQIRVLHQTLQQLGFFLVSVLSAFILFLPWFFYATQIQMHNYGYPGLPDLSLERTLQAFSILLTVQQDKIEPLFWLMLILMIVGLLASFAFGWFQTSILAITLTIAVPIAWIADQSSHYIWLERQVIFILPLMYLLAAHGIVCLINIGLRLVQTYLKNWGFHFFIFNKFARIGFFATFVCAWGILNWNFIRTVYADQFLLKDDWRNATNYISTNSTPNAHFYSALGPHDNYGLGYYNSALLGKITDFCTNPQANFGADDWLVLYTDSGAAPCSAERVHNYFVEHGWGYKEFAGLRVYSQHLHLVQEQKVISLNDSIELNHNKNDGHFYEPLQLPVQQQYSFEFAYNQEVKPNQLVVQIQFFDINGRFIHNYPPFSELDVATYNADSSKTHFAGTF